MTDFIRAVLGISCGVVAIYLPCNLHRMAATRAARTAYRTRAQHMRRWKEAVRTTKCNAGDP